MLECLNVRMFERLNVRMFKCSNVSMFECLNVGFLGGCPESFGFLSGRFFRLQNKKPACERKVHQGALLDFWVGAQILRRFKWLVF